MSPGGGAGYVRYKKSQKQGEKQDFTLGGELWVRLISTELRF